MPALLLTLVRHGESLDNLRALWAGHRDAPLSQHGFNQSLRLAAALEKTPITAIYTSDLKRAHTTATNVFKQNASVPKPAFTVSALMREQNFGLAEGEPWDAGKYSSSHLPWDDHRNFTIAEEAESLNDVAQRADYVIRHFILPHILASADESAPQRHIVLVAHGIFLSETLFALKRAGDKDARFVKTSGYSNTGYSTLSVSLASVDPSTVSSTVLPPLSPSAWTTTSGADSLPPPFPDNDPIPPLHLIVHKMNEASHLEGLERQKGGIGSSAHDEKQRKLTEFLGGGATGAGEP